MYIPGQRSWGLNIMETHVSSSALLLRLKNPAKYKKSKKIVRYQQGCFA